MIGSAVKTPHDMTHHLLQLEASPTAPPFHCGSLANPRRADKTHFSEKLNSEHHSGPLGKMIRDEIRIPET